MTMTGNAKARAHAMGRRRRLNRRTFWTITTVALIGFFAAPALADGVNPAGALAAFDMVDSKGLKISQYQLSLDDGGWSNPGQGTVVFLLSLIWTSYCWWVGFMSWIVEWTVSMQWVPTITGPFADVSTQLRTQLLTPLGGTTLGGSLIVMLMSITGLVATISIARGKTSGWTDIASTIVVAVAATSILVAPVNMFIGDGTSTAAPLRIAQRFGTELATLVSGGKISNAPIDQARPQPKPGVPDPGEISPPAPLKIGPMLVDAFIRPAHQQINYGLTLDDTKCEQPYQDALKAGPYLDSGKLSGVRDAVGRCNNDAAEFAKHPTGALVLVSGIFGVATLLLGALVLVFVVLMWARVVSVCWTALMTSFHVLWALLPGHAKGPLIRDLINIIVDLFYLASATAGLAVVLAMIKATLKANVAAPVLIRFAAVDLLLIAGMILLGYIWHTHSKGGRNLFRRVSERLRQPAKETVGRRISKWMREPAPISTQLAQAGGAPSAAMRRPASATGSPATSTVGQMLRQRALATNGGLAAAVAANAGRSTVLAAAKLAAVPVSGGASALIGGAEFTAKATQAYRAARSGARRAPVNPGSATDRVGRAFASAHTHLTDLSAAAKARAIRVSAGTAARLAMTLPSTTRRPNSNPTGQHATARPGPTPKPAPAVPKRAQPTPKPAVPKPAAPKSTQPKTVVPKPPKRPTPTQRPTRTGAASMGRPKTGAQL